MVMELMNGYVCNAWTIFNWIFRSQKCMKAGFIIYKMTDFDDDMMKPNIIMI